MDDLVPSLDSIERAIETRRQLTEMGDKAGFHVRKWVSNLTEVLADVPEEDRASEVNLEKNERPVTKTLGVLDCTRGPVPVSLFATYRGL